MPPIQGYKHLLVLVDHLTHWVEAFPTKKETAEVVAKIILEEIVPRYGLVNNIDSDRGSHFTAQALKEVIRALGMKWRLHTPWHPQSSGRVERMNKTLKNVLTKLISETQMNWLKCLPLALLRIRTRPRSDIGVSPYEMMFGLPFLITPFSTGNYIEGETATRKYIEAIGRTLRNLRRKGYLPQTSPLDADVHQINPGDWVLIKSWNNQPLTPRFEGPFQVLLTTHTAVRTQEREIYTERLTGYVLKVYLVKEKPVKTQERDDLDTPLRKNLFIDLVEKISKELNLTDCWVCGNTQMTDIWPWEGISLSPLEILRWEQIRQEPQTGVERGKEQWDLKSKVIGEECIMRTGKRYHTPMGKMALNPFWGIRELSKFWESPTEIEDTFWEAPPPLFWICGDTAYTKLPGDWAGSCTIGIIKPAFFLLPKESGAHLGVPVYDDLRKTKKRKRSIIEMGGSQKWKGTIWTPEKIIKTYGPATWAQDGSWGYRTPIYMLNRIIRLQAVLEVVSNRTALALDHISDQLTQTRAVIYQIRLAVDYLLADEGGICGKFNSSECCLEIDDKSSVIKNISKEIRKLAYVADLTNKGLSKEQVSWPIYFTSLLGAFFPLLPGFPLLNCRFQKPYGIYS
uniref:Integrase catalytic domain-containing protein n=1 Tax=Catharus ustulatus TaxID=91951 RepID=A0A8C3TPZ6_CATUS